jgi:hypothetical protein
LVVGGVIAKAASPTVFAGTEKLDKTVVVRSGSTVKIAVIVAELKVALLACNAVMVEVPIPRIVIVLPAIVATAVFELVYVKAPVLFEVGAVIVKAASPIFFKGIEKLVIVGFGLVTVNTAVIA